MKYCLTYCYKTTKDINQAAISATWSSLSKEQFLKTVMKFDTFLFNKFMRSHFTVFYQYLLIGIYLEGQVDAAGEMGQDRDGREGH